MRNRLHFILLALLGLSVQSPVAAHEFWLEPGDATPHEGDTVTASLRVGEMMEGAELPYLSKRFQRFTITTPVATYDVERREGDQPAVAYDHDEPGLHILAHEAEPMQAEFSSWEEFTEYLAYEGLGEIAAAHESRDLPREPVLEDYTRHAKALIQVGPVRDGTDRELGLRFELIAGANPYDPEIKVLPLTLLWEGEPVSGQQIAIFQRSKNGIVTRRVLETDNKGQAVITRQHDFTYLLNAVRMTKVDPEDADGAVWHSHWASLYFGDIYDDG